jgi:transcriptional regulator with XRE-family HTH domain
VTDLWEVRHGDCRDIMRALPAESVDAIVSDPPYGLEFMGKAWDRGVPGVEFWAEALRVAKPGAHLVAFGGTRTFHRLAVAIEDAGWEVRDCLSWLYGSGFPKSLDVSKQIDKHGGTPPAWFGPWFRAWRESQGITQKQVAALFPSKTGNLTGCVANWELGFNLPTPEQFNLIRDTFGLPFDSIEAAEREVVGQKDSNLLAVAPGQENDRSATTLDITAPATDAAKRWHGWGTALKPAWEPIILARKPLTGTVAANVTQYGTGAINVDGCRIGTDGGGTQCTNRDDNGKCMGHANAGRSTSGETFHGLDTSGGRWPANVLLDEDAAVALGQTSRFFYTAKVSRNEREAGLDGLVNNHPTLKPIALMRWLCRLVAPPGGVVLDPFNGSGSTGCAAALEGLRYLGCELEAEYVEIARRRIAYWYTQRAQPDLFG